MKLRMMLFLGLFIAFAAACGDEDSHDENSHDEAVESPQEEACEHMVEGPDLAVTAADAPENAPDGTAEHTRIDVTFITDDMGTNGGYVSYEAEETGEYLIFTSGAIPFAILDANGADVALESTELVSECDEVVEQHMVDLEVGSYVFVFGPTDEGSVSFVVEHGGEHDHEGHDEE